MDRLAHLVLRITSGAKHRLTRRCTPAGALVLALLVASAAIGVDTTISLAHQVFTFCLALVLVGTLAAWRRPARFAVARRLPEFATAGEPCRYRVELTSLADREQRGLALREQLADPRPDAATFAAAGRRARSPFRRWARLVDARPVQAVAETPVERLGPRERRSVTVELTPERRGAVVFDGALLARSEPLGLFRGLRVERAPGSLLVLPRRFRVPGLDLPGHRNHQPGGVELAGSVGDSEEFIGLRDYRPGDPLQRVHWKSFARAGKPVVREYQEEYFERHALVLDTHVDDGAPALEDAVSLAASFACTVDARESLLDLLFVDGRSYCVTAGRGLLPAEGLLEILAHVHGSRDHSLGALRDSVLERRDRLSGCVLVLADWDERRRALVDELHATGLELLAYVISAATPPPAAEGPWMRVLRAGSVEEDLAR